MLIFFINYIVKIQGIKIKLTLHAAAVDALHNSRLRAIDVLSYLHKLSTFSIVD